MDLGTVSPLRVLKEDATGTTCINQVKLMKPILVNGLIKLVNWTVHDDLTSYITEVNRVDESYTIHTNSQPKNGTYFLAVKICISAHSSLEYASLVSFSSQVWLNLGSVINLLKRPILATVSSWIQSSVIGEVRAMLAFAKIYCDAVDSDGLENVDLDAQFEKIYETVLLLSSTTTTGKLE